MVVNDANYYLKPVLIKGICDGKMNENKIIGYSVNLLASISARISVLWGTWTCISSHSRDNNRKLSQLMRYSTYHIGDQSSDIQPHWMAAHGRPKNEFTEDEKYYNHMTWLN